MLQKNSTGKRYGVLKNLAGTCSKYTKLYYITKLFLKINLKNEGIKANFFKSPCCYNKKQRRTEARVFLRTFSENQFSYFGYSHGGRYLCRPKFKGS